MASKEAAQRPQPCTKRFTALRTFLDIEGAFSNVTSKAIREALIKCKLDDTITKWIMNMICNRFVTVEVKNHQKRIRIQRGCPQGGILSPFLWNLVVNDLLKHAEENNIGNLQAFADDLLSLVIQARSEISHRELCG